MNTTIRISHLSFNYNNQPVLSDINLDILKSEYIAILGPNGGGKSTLIKLIVGILKSTSGSIISDKKLKIGYIPQRITTNLEFPATVFEIIESGGVVDPTIIKKLNLDSLLYRTIGELSGGECQKVFIARCLMSKPDFLILDEPTVGIDQQSQDEFWMLLKNLHQVDKIGVILVSHDIAEVTKDATRILYLNQILEYDKTSHMYLKKENLDKILHRH